MRVQPLRRPCATTSLLTTRLTDTVADRTDELGAAVTLQDLTLSAVHEGIVGLREGRLVLVNDAACAILRLDRKDLLGRFVFEVLTVGPEDHSLLGTIYEAIAARRQFTVDDERLKCVDGTVLCRSTCRSRRSCTPSSARSPWSATCRTVTRSSG